MLKETIKEILDDLTKYENVDRNELYTSFINYKLTNTLKQYNKEIEDSSDKLVKAASVRVMKAITKLQKRQDVENIKIEIEKAKSQKEDNIDD